MASVVNALTSRPEGNMPGGRGQYCCIPDCGSAKYDRRKTKTGIGLFKFPLKDKQPALYRSWASVIRNYRRKGFGDTFDLANKNNVICEYHFKNNEVKKHLVVVEEKYS